MAWNGDSYITAGVYRAIEQAVDIGASILFFTDGHEAPPLHWTGRPAFEGNPNEVHGLIVGVGGHALTPIPKHDDDGREIGVYDMHDVLQESRHGLPPPDASERPGWHPRNAPWGAMPEGTEHLSSVKEDNLRAIAEHTGLSYTLLNGGAALLAEFEAAAKTRDVEVAIDVKPYAAGASLFFLVLLYGAFAFASRQSLPNPGQA
jgi:mxaL protein